MSWFLDMRAMSRGGPLAPVKLTDGTNPRDTPGGYLQFFSDIQGRDVLFATHGFENNRSEGTLKLEEWKTHLQIHPEPLFVGVLWPGDGILPIGIDYIWEGSEANKGGTELGLFIDQHFRGANSISFASHSLGARVILQAVRQITAIPRIRNLFLMAGAIEDDTLQAEFADAAAKADSITVLYSYKDQVLQRAYPAGNLLGRLFDRTMPNIKTALGRSGCRTPWIRPVKTNFRFPDGWDYGHSDYLTTATVADDFNVPLTQPGPDTPEPTQPAALVQSTWKPCWSAAEISTLWI